LSAAWNALPVELPPPGGAFYAADRWKECAEKVNKYVVVSSVATLGL